MKLSVTATTEAKKLRSTSGKPSNRADPRRDRYLRAVIDVWLAVGGKLSTTVDVNDHKTSGAVLEFLKMVSAPVFKKLNRPVPSPNAFRHVVRPYQS
jgi:hypothetical protein